MKKWTIATALMSSTLLLAACQPANNTDDTNKMEDKAEQMDGQNQTNDKDSPDTKGIQDHSFGLSLNDAVDTFREKYGNMEIYSAELTTEDKVYQYEIKGYEDGTEYKVHIGADNGDILSADEKEDDGNHLHIAFDKLISPKDAMEKVLKEVENGAFVTSWELEEEDGKMAYEVEYDFEGKDGGDITIDAYSGDILEK